MWFWHLELSEIDAWFETKTREFVKKENRNPNHDNEVWLQKYIYTNVHKVFFATFPSELHSWLARLADCSGHTKSDKPAQWNQEVVQILKNIDNIVSRAVDFWLTSLLSGFIIEFVVDTVKAYSEAERQFFKCYRGKFLNSLNLWIKMLLCDKGILQLRSNL
jgi:hypothetical protein